jgi:hypothetical protein
MAIIMLIKCLGIHSREISWFSRYNGILCLQGSDWLIINFIFIWNWYVFQANSIQRHERGSFCNIHARSMQKLVISIYLTAWELLANHLALLYFESSPVRILLRVTIYFSSEHSILLRRFLDDQFYLIQFMDLGFMVYYCWYGHKTVHM